MFEIGDVVRIKPDADKIFTGVYFADDMKEYLGKEAIVESFNKRTFLYTLKDVKSDYGYDWNFSDAWLEFANNKEINIKESDLNELLCLK